MPDTENCRVMTEAEVVEEFRSALQVGAARTKSGRMTVYELVHGIGLQSLASEMAGLLCHYMVFLKKPPMGGHSTPKIENG
jgi:hypothetical protein